MDYAGPHELTAAPLTLTIGDKDIGWSRRLEAAMAHQAKVALQSFNLANDIANISPQDEIYKYDVEENRKILRAEPWKSE